MQHSKVVDDYSPLAAGLRGVDSAGNDPGIIGRNTVEQFATPDACKHSATWAVQDVMKLIANNLIEGTRSSVVLESSLSSTASTVHMYRMCQAACMIKHEK